jgi:hypothetical protein
MTLDTFCGSTEDNNANVYLLEVTELLSAHLLFFLLLFIIKPAVPPFLLLGIAFSIFPIFTCFGMIAFLVIFNPTSKKYWRHMTPPMYLLFVAQLVDYMMFICWGVTIKDIAFVPGPCVIGVGSIPSVFFMRNPNGDQEGGAR